MEQQHTERPATAPAETKKAAGSLSQLLWWDAASCRLVWLATTALLADTALRAAGQAAAGPSLLATAAWVVSAVICSPAPMRMQKLLYCLLVGVSGSLRSSAGCAGLCSAVARQLCPCTR